MYKMIAPINEFLDFAQEGGKKSRKQQQQQGGKWDIVDVGGGH